MNIELTVERIKTLSKTKGFKTKYICKNLGVRDNYFTDCKAKKLIIPDDILKPLAIRKAKLTTLSFTCPLLV